MAENKKQKASILLPKPSYILDHNPFFNFHSLHKELSRIDSAINEHKPFLSRMISRSNSASEAKMLKVNLPVGVGGVDAVLQAHRGDRAGAIAAFLREVRP